MGEELGKVINGHLAHGSTRVVVTLKEFQLRLTAFYSGDGLEGTLPKHMEEGDVLNLETGEVVSSHYEPDGIRFEGAMHLNRKFSELLR